MPAVTPNRLREWRLRTRHSQREVALILGCTTTSVTRHEQGNRGLTHKMVLAYAGLYKLPTYALFVKPADDRMIEPEATRQSNRIRRLRFAAKLTPGEVFRLTGILPATLKVIESEGYLPTHTEIVALARLFKVPTYQLFVKPFGNEEAWFAEDINAPLDPRYEETTGDHGTPYEEFTGGYEARYAMATAR